MYTLQYISTESWLHEWEGKQNLDLWFACHSWYLGVCKGCVEPTKSGGMAENKHTIHTNEGKKDKNDKLVNAIEWWLSYYSGTPKTILESSESGSLKVASRYVTKGILDQDNTVLLWPT